MAIRIYTATAVLSLASCITGAQAQSTVGKPVEATQLDIAGIRLYMTAEEVVTSLKGKFGANIPVLRTDNRPGNARENIRCLAARNTICIHEETQGYRVGRNPMERRQYVETGRAISIIEFRNVNKYDFSIIFAKDGKAVTIRMSDSTRNGEEALSNAVAKYGPATVVYKRRGAKISRVEWCASKILVPVDKRTRTIACPTLNGIPSGNCYATGWPPEDLPDQTCNSELGSVLSLFTDGLSAEGVIALEDIAYKNAVTRNAKEPADPSVP